VLHQMTWPPQSSDLNPIEMVWDELDRRVREKKPTSDQHSSLIWLRECKVCKAVIKAKGGYFEESQIYLDLFNTFLVIT
jgi:transposase